MEAERAFDKTKKASSKVASIRLGCDIIKQGLKGMSKRNIVAYLSVMTITEWKSFIILPTKYLMVARKIN